MKIVRRQRENMVYDNGPDLRVLARVKTVEALVFHVLDDNDRLLRTLEMTRSNKPFEYRECVEPMSYDTTVRLCAEFNLTSYNHQTNKVIRSTDWYIIEK